jgi:hypothetical protein
MKRKNFALIVVYLMFHFVFEWRVSDEIYYQKQPKAICSDYDCFQKQNGTLDKLQSKQNSFASFRDQVIVSKLPDATASDNVKKVADVWDEYLVTAHHRTKDLYPEQDVNTHVFGQIRSKIIDQFLAITELLKEK